MITLAGLTARSVVMFAVAVAVGTALTRLAQARPARSPIVETLLGALLCSGLLLLGASLARFC